MNKNELADHIAGKTDLSAAQAREAIDATFATIADELVGGREVAVAGFGKFTTSERAAREGRNPSNGETIQIAASTAAKFTAAAGLKKQLND